MPLKLHRYSEDALSIYDVMSADECASWIARAESLGFAAATLDTGAMPEFDARVRDNDRVLIADAEWAETLWRRVTDVIPNTFGRWQASGLNDQFRIYRYGPSQQFKWHFDGSFHRSPTEESRLTFMVYLNQAFEGGATEFDGFTVWPATGAALCFRHGLRHQGARVLSGRKYVLRSDVMFRVGPAPAD